MMMDILLDKPGNVTILEYLCKKCKNDDIIKHVIDESVDIAVPDPSSRYRPIHIVCRYGSPGVIKHIIDKNVRIMFQELVPLFIRTDQKKISCFRALNMYGGFGVDKTDQYIRILCSGSLNIRVIRHENDNIILMIVVPII